MDVYEKLISPSDTISSGHLTLAVFPMFIAIGRLFFDRKLFEYYFKANNYFKIYIDQFETFVKKHFEICEFLVTNQLCEQRQNFLQFTSWNNVQENDKFWCIITNAKDISFKFNFFILGIVSVAGYM